MHNFLLKFQKVNCYFKVLSLNICQQASMNNFFFLIKSIETCRILGNMILDHHIFAVKEKMQKKFPSIAERVIIIALDSVDYNESRAEQILSNVLREEASPKVKIADAIESRRPSYVEPKKP